MPRQCCEISVGFLEEVIAEPSPEGNKDGLEVQKLREAYSHMPQGQRVRSVGPGQAGPQVPAQEHEVGTRGPGRGWCCGM